VDEIVDQLRQHIIADLGIEDLEPADIDPQAPLFAEGLGLDSIDAVELVVMLERRFGIRLTDMAAAKAAFASVATLAEFVRQRHAG
jgi:acyl carrier protein